MKTFLEITSLISNLFTILASGLAIYLFYIKRKDISLAINLILNYSFQTTLTELKEKLERLNEYNANEPTDVPEIKNILHEIVGQIKGNQRLVNAAPKILERVEKLANSSRLSEPNKRSLISEVREVLRNMHVNSIELAPGAKDE